MASLRLALKLSAENEATTPWPPPASPKRMNLERTVDAKETAAPPPQATTAPPARMSREMKALAGFNLVPIQPPSSIIARPEPPPTAPVKGPKTPRGATKSVKKRLLKRTTIVNGAKMCTEEAVQCQKPVRSVKKRPRKDQSKMWGQFPDIVNSKDEDAADVQLAEPDEITLKVVAALAKEDQNHEAGADECNWVRRSVRASGQSELSSRQVAELLEVIKGNHKDAVVLKLKHWLGPDTNTWVIDAVLSALMKNDNCEALYIQNFNDGTNLVLLILDFFRIFIRITEFQNVNLDRYARPSTGYAIAGVESWPHMVFKYWRELPHFAQSLGAVRQVPPALQRHPHVRLRARDLPRAQNALSGRHSLQSQEAPPARLDV